MFENSKWIFEYVMIKIDIMADILVLNKLSLMDVVLLDILNKLIQISANSYNKAIF